MRIVAFADTHQFHEDLTVPAGDVLLCAGDVCRAGDREELDAFFAWFVAHPHRHKLFVPGNHDVCVEEACVAAQRAWPGVTFLVDGGVVVDGVSFWGSPWTPEFHQWAFMLKPGPQLAAKWSLIPDGIDVLVTHGPPRGILDDAGSYRGIADGEARHVGCAALRDRVARVRPRVHLFGHIHTCRGVVDVEGTRFVNCTTNEAELPVSVVDV